MSRYAKYALRKHYKARQSVHKLVTLKKPCHGYETRRSRDGFTMVTRLSSRDGHVNRSKSDRVLYFVTCFYFRCLCLNKNRDVLNYVKNENSKKKIKRSNFCVFIPVQIPHFLGLNIF
jgi:hypothetical protein